MEPDGVDAVVVGDENTHPRTLAALSGTETGPCGGSNLTFTLGRRTGAGVSMPNADGLSVCRILRERGCDTQILMLMARQEVGDRVAGLDAVWAGAQNGRG